MLATSVQGLRIDSALLKSGRWETLRGHLDTLPVWTCVDPTGAPLGYERDGNQFAIFFADPLHAQEELDTRAAENPQLNLRSMGVGLGDAFARSVRGDGLLVASRDALAQAGEDWDSDDIPLYTCLGLSVPNTSGEEGRVLPLFLDPTDAQRSLDAALSSAAGTELSESQLAQMQLVCTPLSKAVEFVVTGTEKASTGADRFQFVASSRAVAFLREQMEPANANSRSGLQEQANAMKQEEASKGLIFPE